MSLYPRVNLVGSALDWNDRPVPDFSCEKCKLMNLQDSMLVLRQNRTGTAYYKYGTKALEFLTCCFLRFLRRKKTGSDEGRFRKVKVAAAPTAPYWPFRCFSSDQKRIRKRDLDLFGREIFAEKRGQSCHDIHKILQELEKLAAPSCGFHDLAAVPACSLDQSMSQLIDWLIRFCLIVRCFDWLIDWLFLCDRMLLQYLAQFLERCEKDIGIFVLLAPISSSVVEKWSIHDPVLREGIDYFLEVAVVLHRVVRPKKVVHGYYRVLWITNDIDDLRNEIRETHPCMHVNNGQYIKKNISNLCKTDLCTP